jgi:hypothetical protein
MTLAAMTQEARPACLTDALPSNGPVNNDSAFPVAQAGPGSSLAGAYLNDRAASRHARIDWRLIELATGELPQAAPPRPMSMPR